jgi:predicted transcriptional regulator of viral defense system
MTMLTSRILERASRTMIFRTAEMASWLGTPPSEVSRALGELSRRGLVTSVVRGLWANTRHPRFAAMRLIPYLVGDDTRGDVTAYLSGISALAFHGMISQIPATVHVVVIHRRRALETPAGEFRFHLISRRLFDGIMPGDSHAYFHVATPTKSLFDTLYFSVRKGARWRYLPEIELPRTVTDVGMQEWIAKLQTERLRVAVNARWQELRRKR